MADVQTDTPKSGISVVICCYNSSERLPATLRHLQAQQDADGIAWEVIVVDNASTDNTAAVAESIWSEKSITPLRIVHEPQAGLSYARARGAAAARYDIIALVDDDNWTPPHWLTTVEQIFRQHPEVGVVGGPTTEVCESEPPAWFQTFKGHYAVYGLDSPGGIVEQYVCGAGLCFRKAAWEQLLSDGFEGELTDRKGKELTSGGDTEICAALRLSGWKIWYEPALLIQHFIPTGRLNWDYLTRLNIGFGKQSVYLDAYYALLPSFTHGTPAPPCWMSESLKAVRALIGLFPQIAFRSEQSREGSASWLIWKNQCARLATLLRERGSYAERFRRIAGAKWNHSKTPPL
ncbi:glycosyltransferase [Ruficoccus sp. ZRK36]|uniref:glycosyltransferase n=1 Tax=Ruficoccus sp. ZRK36 TaxID=2866311 RepID=UPI001C72E4EB|nr:glycosyltransferase [Ruficoccus sp. ZRK36]QYY36320.1 glycosyltransferase family 2 protein [Ruficoccus sp. ZRK36]